MLWHQTLKALEHYCFSRTKKNRFEGQNMGGIKDMLSPPMSKHGGGYITPRIYALGSKQELLSNYRSIIDKDNYVY